MIAEKGGACLTYDENGQRKLYIDETIKVPQSLQDDIKKMVEKPEYSGTLVINPTKCTMVTVVIRSKEERGEKTFEDFLQAQESLTEELKNVVNQNNLTDDFRVDKTHIAIDIESKRVGKSYGARRFVEILKERGIKPLEYVSFGDSASDYQMHEELRRLGKQAKFVFVQGKDHLAGKDLRGVTFTQQYADKGTLEYLQSEFQIDT